MNWGSTLKQNLNSSVNQALEIVDGYFGQFFTGKKDYIKEGYKKNAYVYMVINKIAKTCQSLESSIKNGSGSEIEDGEYFDTYERFKILTEDALIQFETTGELYFLYTDNIGFGSFKVLKSKRVTNIINNQGILIGYNYKPFTDSRPTPLDINDVIHIVMPDPECDSVKDSHNGLSPMEPMWGEVISCNEITTAEASIFKNRGIIGFVTNKSDRPMTPTEKKDTQEDFQQKSGGAVNYNKVRVTNANIDFVQVGMSPADLKLTENKINKLRIIAPAFGLDSKLFGDGDNTSYNNMAEAQKGAYQQVYIPTMQLLNYNAQLFLNKKFTVNYSIKVNERKVEALKKSLTFEQMVLERVDEGEIDLFQASVLLKGKPENQPTSK